VYAQLFCKAVAIGHAQLQRHKLLMKQFPKRTPYNCQQGIVIKHILCHSSCCFGKPAKIETHNFSEENRRAGWAY
jgi:hypothetical protein